MRHKLQKTAAEGRFGLEKESLRVNRYTMLPSVSDHPFGKDPNISRDFCEAQTEIITPVCRDTTELFDVLHRLNTRVKETLSEHGEILWNQSNPPAGYNERRIRIAHFDGPEQEKEEYRRYLKEKYGISRMLLCGIHYNFSFTEDALKVLSFTEEKDALYLKLAAYVMKYAWLITFLTAASPVLGCRNNRHTKKENYASLRCSERGYWNPFIPALDYSSLGAYINSIQMLVDTGKLYSASELYLPVRVKSKGVYSLSNLKNGISHIELRMLDINPLEEDGIKKEDIDFIHFLLMMWAMRESVCFDADAQRCAVRNMKRAALLDETKIWIEEPKGLYLPVRNAALQFLAEMDHFYETWKDPYILSLIGYERRKILNSKTRYAERVLTECANYSESQAITV